MQEKGKRERRKKEKKRQRPKSFKHRKLNLANALNDLERETSLG